MGDIERSRGLTQAELADVLRRAAELDADLSLPVPVAGFDPAVVEAAAVEAGLSPQAVRRAMHEVLHPDELTPDVYADGRLPSRDLVLVREVPGTVTEVEAQVGRFLRRQLFEQKRIFTDGSKWAPRKGLMANVRRGADPGGRYVLKEVSAVAVTVSAVDGSDATVLLRVVLDLTSVRSIHRAWLAGGAISGAAALGGAGVVFGLDPAALLAVPVAGGLTAGGHFLGRWNARREVETIHTAVAGMLDRLEHADRAPAPRRSTARHSSRARAPRSGSSRRTESTPDTIEPMNTQSDNTETE